jgi:hypothetical protein
MLKPIELVDQDCPDIDPNATVLVDYVKSDEISEMLDGLLLGFLSYFCYFRVVICDEVFDSFTVQVCVCKASFL